MKKISLLFVLIINVINGTIEAPHKIIYNLDERVYYNNSYQFYKDFCQECLDLLALICETLKITDQTRQNKLFEVIIIKLAALYNRAINDDELIAIYDIYKKDKTFIEFQKQYKGYKNIKEIL